MARLTRFELACLTIVGLAGLLRITHILHPQVDWDAAWYLLLARSFGETGTSVLPWTDPPQYDTYWPPLFPIFAAPFVKAFGPSYHSLAAAAVFASALLTAAAFWCTRDLYGRKVAFAVMAAVAASPAFYVSDSRAMSESLLALFATLTVWAFLRGIERPRFLPLALLFGALAYLSKASLGIALIAPLVALGLGWRVWSVGPRAWLARRLEVGVALAALAGLALAASIGPTKVGSIGLGAIGPLITTFSLGAAWWKAFALKLAFAIVFLLFVTFPFSFRLREAWAARRGEREGALWLATLLPLLAGAVFTTTFYFAQDRPLVDFDNIRYLVPAVVPFLWLTAPRFLAEPAPQAPPAPNGKRRGSAPPPAPAPRERWVIASAIVLTAVYALSPFAVTPSLPRLALLAALTAGAIALAFPQIRATRAQEPGFLPTALASTGLFLGGVAWFLWPILTTTWRAAIVLALVACAGGIVWRRQALASTRWTPIAIAALVPFLGFHVSMWFAMVAAGLLVAMAARVPTTAGLVMSLVLLSSAAPIGSTVAPDDEVAQAVRDLGLPPGSVVGIDEPAVYSAAIMPEDLDVVVVEDPDAAPPEVEALVLSTSIGRHEDFTPVAAFRNERDPNELLALRLAIERSMGIETPLEGSYSYVIYVRTD